MYIKEVQGLRLFAALLVAIYHIWFGRVSGGVDAFFVIAGFFVYGSFFKSGDPGWPELFRLYKRTAARVVPSASVVILATCVGFVSLGIDSLWGGQIKSALAAVLFVENWRLALASVDYLAQDQVPSPFQQMWALSVQVQMYLALPMALFLGAAAVRRFGLSRGCFAGGVAVLMGASFAYAIYSVQRDQAFAYFDTFARMWEFLAGVMLAICLPMIRVTPARAKVLGYASLIVLTGFALVIPVGNSFPGLPALVPVLATSGIIIAARNHAEMGLLTAPVMQRLGDLSFTFYLWHWPMLIAFWLMHGSREVSVPAGLGIMLLAGGLAWATYHLIERPFRRSAVATGPVLKAALVSAVLMLPAATGAGIWAWRYVDLRDSAWQALADFRREGKAASLVPGTVIARLDLANGYRRCLLGKGQATPVECVYGNEDGKTEIVLVGGSHSLQWLPALEEIAQASPDMKITVLTKASCPLTLSDVGLNLLDAENCLSWNRRIIERIREIDPEKVVTLLSWTSIRGTADGIVEAIPEGFGKAWNALGDISIIAIRDNPRAPFNLVDCVDRVGTEAAGQCAVARSAVLDDSVLAGIDLPGNVRPVDLSEMFCEGDTCPAVRGNVLLYRDSNHITATYARILAPKLQKKMEQSLVLSSR